MDGQGDAANEMLENLEGVELHRFDTDVDRAHTRMDDATPGNLEHLTVLGEELATRERPRLSRLAEALVGV
jgi:hypothetical protein